MNLADSVGGSSCKGRENGDAPNDSERPLKKARFAWQVKGKYHLKNDTSDIGKTSTTESIDPDMAGSSSSGSDSKITGSEQNLEILGDYLLKQDFNALDSVTTDSEKSLLKPSTSIQTDNLQYPRYVSSFDNASRCNDSSNETESPSVSMVAAQNYTEEQCIARWQARQMAKGFVDNTINRVLDSWLQVPLVEVDESRFLALDVADFINNLPGDNSVENEGILMAISAHGLQNTSNSSSTSIQDTENNSEQTSIIDPPTSPQRSLSPPPSDDESQEQQSTNNNQCDTDNSMNDLYIPWLHSDNQRNESNEMTGFPLLPDPSSLSYDYVNDSNYYSNSSCDGITSAADNHCEFLDAAILCAIQSKGLTPFGTDYG